MNITPIHPDDVADDERPPTELTRRTFGWRHPSRRTFGFRHPSRRTFGWKHP